MRKLIAASSLVITAIILFTLFYPFDWLKRKDVIYDDEQEGLSEQIVIRFSHVVAENTPKGLAAQKFAQLVKEKTDGLVKVEVIPNGNIYTDEEELDALRRNEVQMIAPSLSKMTKLAPEWGLFDLPFLFKDYNDISSTLTSEIGSKFLTMHEDKGIKGLALWSNGFKQMTSNVKALKNPDDFAGQRFRIMPSLIIEKQFTTLGASPVVVPFNELYRSLQQDEFEGQENTISNIYSRRIYGLQNHMTVSNHGFLGYAVLMNKDFWDGLPEDIQPAIDEAMKETTAWMLAESKEMNQIQLEKIKQESSIDIYYLSEEETREWYTELKPVYSTFLEAVKVPYIKEFVKKKMQEWKTQ